MNKITLTPLSPLPKNIIINDNLKIIMINAKIFELHDKIKVFRLLKQLLINENQTIGKIEIFENLWPDERFLPRTHTPRIYDIIKRIKNLCGEDLISIESNKQGYKLNLLY